MTDADYRRFRAALRSEARPLILALERRGCTLRVHHGRVQVRPAGRLDAESRQILRQPEAVVLVAQRAAWTEWPQPVPRFDPSTAFTSHTKDTRP